MLHMKEKLMFTYNTANILRLTFDGNAELDGLPDADGARLGNELGALLGDVVRSSCSKGYIENKMKIGNPKSMT